jgi:hypothetical protein
MVLSLLQKGLKCKAFCGALGIPFALYNAVVRSALALTRRKKDTRQGLHPRSIFKEQGVA